MTQIHGECRLQSGKVRVYCQTEVSAGKKKVWKKKRKFESTDFPDRVCEVSRQKGKTRYSARFHVSTECPTGVHRGSCYISASQGLTVLLELRKPGNRCSQTFFFFFSKLSFFPRLPRFDNTGTSSKSSEQSVGNCKATK